MGSNTSMSETKLSMYSGSYFFLISFFFRDLVPCLSSSHPWSSLQHFRRIFFNLFPFWVISSLSINLSCWQRKYMFHVSTSSALALLNPSHLCKVFSLEITQTSYLLFLLDVFQYLPYLTSWQWMIVFLFFILETPALGSWSHSVILPLWLWLSPVLSYL